MGEKNSDRNKTSKKTTWFGFTLTHNQALILFTLALIGVLTIPMTLLSAVFSMIYYISNINLINIYSVLVNGPYYLQSFVFNLSAIISMCVFLVVCFYTIIRTRKMRENSP